jgi:DNA mismatch repair protein MutH
MGLSNSWRELNEAVVLGELNGVHALLDEARRLGAELAMAPGLSRAGSRAPR